MPRITAAEKERKIAMILKIRHKDHHVSQREIAEVVGCSLRLVNEVLKGVERGGQYPRYRGMERSEKERALLEYKKRFGYMKGHD